MQIREKREIKIRIIRDYVKKYKIINYRFTYGRMISILDKFGGNYGS